MNLILRKTLSLILCASVALLSIPLPAFGEETNNRTVTVGIFEFDGYHMQDDEGNLSGYGIELLEMIERYSHINFEMVGYDRSWAEMLEMLENGEIDMVTTARYTPERAEKFAYSLPIGRNKTNLTTRVSNKSITGGDYATYDGMLVGVIAGSSQNEKLAQFAETKGFTYETLEFEDASDMVDALHAGNVDAILSSDLRRNDDERLLDTVDENDFYAIVRKSDTTLIDEINYAITQIDLQEGDWQNVLYYRYYGPEYSSVLDFTDREKAYIEEVKAGKKTITATAMVDRKPYSYVKDGKLEGILIDYFAAVMEVAELPYEMIVPESVEEYQQLVETNSVDVVIDAMVSDDESAVTSISANGENGFTTDPYMETGFALVTRYDSDGELDILAVGDAQTESVIGQYMDDQIEVIRYPTTEAAMQAVVDGAADAAYVYSYSAQLFANSEEADSLHLSIVHDLSTRFAMYVRDTADHELATILDKCLQLVPRSKLGQLISEYTAYTLGNMSFLGFLRANPVLAWLIGLGILAVILALFALYLRFRWNQRLLRAEEESNKELGEQLAIVDALSRDYTNVFAVDTESGRTRVVKLEGYVTEGLKRDSDIEYEYTPILTKYVETRVHPEDRESLMHDIAFETVKEKLQEFGEYTGTYRILSDGEEHNYQYVHQSIEEDDGTSFILVGFRNIDEAIRSEREQKKILSEALAQAQYANKAKTTFLNNMSHDIRTPMNAIIGFTSLASTHIDDTALVQDYLGKIMTSSDHLLSLINDVLDMSRIESGKVMLDEQEVNILDIMQDLKTIVQTDIKAKRLELTIDMVDIKDPIVICDKLRLNQVILNILSNAMKYTQPGGHVSVRVTQDAARDGHADYTFYIKDTGIGMSREFLAHVFEPFERESTATISGIEGTGLGLAITKNIVDMMKGTIGVESEVGVGSLFTVHFRLKIADGSSKPQETEQKAERRFDGKRILLAEDNELNAEIAQAVLEAAGFAVDIADDGTVAVQMMEEHPAGTYDLVLSDVQMPIMNGYELTRTIRAMEDPEKANIPIVAMTANAFEEDREEATAAGMNGYVHKPINVKTLMDVLGEML